MDATLSMMAKWTLTGLIADLPRLRVPTLFVVGTNDRAVPPETSHRASGRIEGSRVEAFPGLGHLLHEEAPDATARILRDFLSPDIASPHHVG